VRLRVDPSGGYFTPTPQRFGNLSSSSRIFVPSYFPHMLKCNSCNFLLVQTGQRFVGRVANPTDILLIQKKAKITKEERARLAGLPEEVGTPSASSTLFISSYPLPLPPRPRGPVSSVCLSLLFVWLTGRCCCSQEALAAAERRRRRADRTNVNDLIRSFLSTGESTLDLLLPTELDKVFVACSPRYFTVTFFAVLRPRCSRLCVQSLHNVLFLWLFSVFSVLTVFVQALQDFVDKDDKTAISE
jgi:hypothetical protein